MSRIQPVEVPALAPAPAPAPIAPSLEGAAAAVVAELRESLAALLAGFAEPVRRAVDLERSLNLEKKLAWQIFRIAHSEGLAEVGNVPSRTAVNRLLQAAQRRKASKDVLNRVRAAFDQFEDFAITHGEDREGFLSVVGGIAGGSSDQYEVKIRRNLFRANSHVWGVKAEMQIRTGISFPKAGQQFEDIALIMGDIGLQRLRESSPLNMVRWCRPSSPDQNTSQDTPLVDRGIGLLQQFCTHPLPNMEPRASVQGGNEMELVIPTGRAGAVNIYSTHLLENADATPHPYYDGRMFITMPVETAVWDLLVPAGLTNPSTARAVVYGRRPHPEQVYEERHADLLAQHETVRYLGAMEGVPALDGAPRYPEVIQHVLGNLGWAGTRFDVYRCRVMYPILHTLLCVRIDAMKR